MSQALAESESLHVGPRQLHPPAVEHPGQFSQLDRLIDGLCQRASETKDEWEHLNPRISGTQRAELDAYNCAPLRLIGAKVCETVKYDPRYLYALRAKFPEFPLTDAKSERMVAAPRHARAPMPNAEVNLRLPAHPVVTRFTYQLPLNRVNNQVKHGGYAMWCHHVRNYSSGSSAWLAPSVAHSQPNRLASVTLGQDHTPKAPRRRWRRQPRTVRLWVYLARAHTALKLTDALYQHENRLTNAGVRDLREPARARQRTSAAILSPPVQVTALHAGEPTNDIRTRQRAWLSTQSLAPANTRNQRWASESHQQSLRAHTTPSLYWAPQVVFRPLAQARRIADQTGYHRRAGRAKLHPRERISNNYVAPPPLLPGHPPTQGPPVSLDLTIQRKRRLPTREPGQQMGLSENVRPVSLQHNET